MARITLNEDVQKQIQKHLDSFDDININKFKEIKEIANRTFGEENNQIFKPSIDDCIDMLAAPHMANGLSEADAKQHAIHQLNSSFGPGSSANSRTTYLNNNFGMQFIVKFPLIKISNGRNSRDLTDLFVRIRLNAQGNFIGSLEGLRGSVTEGEYRAGYSHSHLPRRGDWTSYNWAGFCLGSGEIGQLIGRLQHNYERTTFQAFCLMLKVFAGWESLDGGPYIHMSDVNDRGASTPVVAAGGLTGVDSGNVELLFNTIIKHITVNNSVEDLTDAAKITISQKGVIIEKTDELERMIDKALESINPFAYFNRESFRCFRKQNGQYIISTSVTGNLRIPDKTLLIFKGEKIKLKLSSKLDNNETKEKFPHPAVTEGICGKLSKYFTQQIHEYSPGV